MFAKTVGRSAESIASSFASDCVTSTKLAPYLPSSLIIRG